MRGSVIPWLQRPSEAMRNEILREITVELRFRKRDAPFTLHRAIDPVVDEARKRAKAGRRQILAILARRHLGAAVKAGFVLDEQNHGDQSEK